MICTTIQKKSYAEICGLIPTLEMAEIRMDSCDLSLEEIEELFASEVPLVATCRGAAAEGRDKLVGAVKAGAAYVDVEDDAPQETLDAVRKAAQKYGTALIVSHHDFSGTPSYGELKAVVEDCFRKGADVAKIVTTASSEEDCARVMSLYDDFVPTSLLAFCMGEAGRETRVECLRRGARYTYAALDGSEPAATGQWPTSEIMEAVYGSCKFFGHPKPASNLRTSSLNLTSEQGDASEPDSPAIRMPASKSFAQRAILAAALAEGESHLHGYTPCFDSEAAISVARELGAEVVVTGGDITVQGITARPESLDIDRLNVGESGLLARLVIPLSAVLSTRDVTIEGSGTLVSRPLKTTDEIMSRFGIRLSSDTVPLKISGIFTEGEAEVSGRGGSQLISGLLMACPLAKGGLAVTVTEPKSIPYMFVTLDVLRKFGVEADCGMDGGGFTEEDGGWGDCGEITFRVKGGQKYKAADIDLEGDWSAAANFLVAGAVFGQVAIAGLDTTSLQADISITDILIGAGVSPIQLDDDEGTLLIRRSPLTAFEADLSDCPDLFPIAAVLAAFCGGTSRIEGIDRLAHKESDRGAAIVEMLTQMGIKTSVEDNKLVVEGHSLAQRHLTGTLLKGGNYTSHHDHRMVMALKVASLGADSPIVIDDEDCVGKSFPDFNEVFTKLCGNS